jgi:predicted MFS family arabinose efflux permease
MLCPTLLVVLLLAGTVRPLMVIALSLVIGVTDALSMPSFQSIVPSIVEHRRIASGLALNSTQFNLSRILGPALAGVLIASVGAVGCFALSAASYVPFIAVALWILPRREPPPGAGEAIDRRHLFAGIREIVREPRLRGALLTVLVTSMLCGPLITFCPVIVRDVLHGDASTFSVAMGAFGIGGLAGAIGLLAVAPGSDLRRLSTRFAAAYGVTVALTALNTWSWALPVLLVFAGVSMNVSNTSANSFLQAEANPRLRGRTVSLYMLAMRGGVSLGSLLTGAAVSFMGVRYALVINGSIAVAVHALVGHIWLRYKPADPVQ